MPSIPNPFAIVARAVRAFFTADVKLQRGRRGLQVVLDAPLEAAKPRHEVRPALLVPSARELRELRRMQAALSSLLDQQASNRQALRHLNFVEHALERSGQRAFQKLPTDVMRRALGQLETLVTNWSDEGLAALRSKLAVALVEREPAVPEAEPKAAQAQAAPESVVDSNASLAHPETLVGDEAAEAEAALLAAYGSMALPGLDLAPAGGAGQDAPQGGARVAEPAH